MSRHPNEGGFTLIEVLTTITLLGTVMAIAVGGWSTWTKASAHSGMAREIQSVMRQAQQRAVTEGGATCVWFDEAADSYSVYRGRCADASKTRVFGPVEARGHVHIDSPSFTSTGGSASSGATFEGRGTGSPGEVRVTRDGSSKVYELSVDWLTGRVSLA